MEYNQPKKWVMCTIGNGIIGLGYISLLELT